uniref:Transmembrane channel-like protein n=1 Tax=Mola mola TaxID=94237 RepID=A0A3Q3WDG0_MOLML
MSKSFGQSFRVDNSHGILAMKVFCSWDFKVIKKTSVKLMSENICTQLKELLAEVSHKNVENTGYQKLVRLMVHGLAWTICIGITTGCVTRHAIHDPLGSEASLLALPVLVSLINLLLPNLFRLTAWMEDYESPSVRTYVAISRNLMLKVSVLGVLCYHWLGRVACWESFVGQELYRFLIIEFIFTLLDTLFGEFLWRYLFSHATMHNYSVFNLSYIKPLCFFFCVSQVVL